MKNYKEILKSLKLKKEYEEIVEKYVKEFSKKHGLHFEYWIADRIGGIACFGDVLMFNFDDIRLDIDTQQPKGQIIEWLYKSLDHPNKSINYSSYSKGLR